MNKAKITALGDSLTKGVILTDFNKYTLADNNYLDIVGKELDMNITNYGKFGSTIHMGSTMIKRHSEEIASSDYTFIEYGGNDCDFDWMKIAECPSENYSPKTTIEEFKEHFISLIEKVRELGSKPIIISLPPILSTSYFSFFSRTMSEEQKKNVVDWLGGDVGIISRWHESYNRALFMIASLTQSPIIDITTAFDTFRGDLRSLYCADGIHPNVEGHRLIASAILQNQL
jgi:lysophospholipase L1-like esterase